MFWFIQYFFPYLFNEENVNEESTQDEMSTQPPKYEEILRHDEEIKEEIIGIMEDNILESDEKFRIFTENKVKKALLIGINYETNDSSDDDLRGCVNDVNNLQDYLLNKCMFMENQMTILTGADATKENIINELNELVHFAHNNVVSELWLSYSGHGSQVNSFTESDGKNEVLCPVDYLRNGIISDDYLKTQFLEKLPNTTKLFVVMDCCHSGSNMDLTYAIENGDIINRHESEIDAKVVKLSGCLDSQVSMDAYNHKMKEFQGAFTDAFIHTNGNCETCELVNNINTYLQTKKYTQISQLSFSKKELVNYCLY